MDVVLAVTNAGFSYDGEKMTFRDINFDVASGEIVSILGPNGAGKSTLLKCINRILTLSNGSVFINEMSLSAQSRKETAGLMGYVSQKEEITFPYNVLEMVIMGRASKLNVFKTPGKHDRDIALETLAYLGIEHLAGRVYNDLSGGESQLVTIARALSAEPKILILDEPTSHLDLKNQMTVFKALVKLSREKGLAVLMTTHQPDHAMILSNRVLLMKIDGTAVFGKTEEIITSRNIRDVFGLDVNIIAAETDNLSLNIVIPDWTAVLL